MVAAADSITVTSSISLIAAMALLQFPDGSAISSAGGVNATGNSETPSISSAISYNANDMLLVVGASNNGYGWVSTASGTPGGSNGYNYAGGSASNNTNRSLYSVQGNTGPYF